MRSLTKQDKQAKLRTLADTEGFETIEALLEASARDSVSPSICTNPECDYTCEMEPDQDSGWCEECDENTMASALILAGLI
jgi:hypothetical protein